MITFTIPKSQSGYELLDFATYVLDNSPAYETRSHMRYGYQALEAIEKAVNSKLNTVSMSDEIGNHFKDAVEQTPVPKLFVVVDGVQGETVPKRFFTQFYEAVENGASDLTSKA